MDNSLEDSLNIPDEMNISHERNAPSYKPPSIEDDDIKQPSGIAEIPEE